MVLYFGKEPEWPGLTTWKENVNVAIVRFSLDADLPLVRVDVDLGSLPSHEQGGTELTVNFQARDFKNNGTFYTDSNGLEMQERILNYRPTWDVEENYKEFKSNISMNFYPVTSAIAIRDGPR